jgi:hypothetical protein
METYLNRAKTIPLDQRCPTFLCTRAEFTDAYGGAGATTLLLRSRMSLILQFELILNIGSIMCAYGGRQKNI